MMRSSTTARWSGASCSMAARTDASAFRQVSWNRGYATEAARAVLDEAFGALTLKRVVATVHEANTASRHVLAKLGFTAAGTITIDGVKSQDVV
jgi:predicted acetyltransferase